jgi:hypothetical protein
MSAFYSELINKERWGFAIYRTDYTSEESWQNFTLMLQAHTMKIIQNKGPRLSPIIHSWQKMWWFDDWAKFENASLQDLRSHFDSWLTSLSPEEKRRPWPEHYMFLVVDTEALNSTHGIEVELPKHYFGEYPYLMVWDKSAPEGDEDYPGWMKIRLREVFYLYELALSVDVKSMRALRSRSTDWFSRDLVVYEDDAYVRLGLDEDEEEEEEEEREDSGQTIDDA